MERDGNSDDDLKVPGFGGGDASTRDGRQALRLHEVIGVIACVLCAFVAGVFVYLGSPVLAVIFAVVALACLGIVVWAARRRSRGRRVERGRR
jgi:Flp pilus assembly protein TadB